MRWMNKSSRKTRRYREPEPPETALCALCQISFETVEAFDAHRQTGSCVPTSERVTPIIKDDGHVLTRLRNPPHPRFQTPPPPRTFAPNAIDLTHLTKQN